MQKTPRLAGLLIKLLIKINNLGLGGGRGEIRTHGGLAPTTVFKTVALNRSATLPSVLLSLKSLRFSRKRDYSKELLILNILIRKKYVCVAKIF